MRGQSRSTSLGDTAEGCMIASGQLVHSRSDSPQPTGPRRLLGPRVGPMGKVHSDATAGKRRSASHWLLLRLDSGTGLRADVTVTVVVLVDEGEAGEVCLCALGGRQG